jgi:protein involved in polysaccharide export with SLBB domain
MKSLTILFTLFAAVSFSAWSAEAPAKPEAETITVLVGGAVKKYGKFELRRNSRVSDAIAKAGGVTDMALLHKVRVTRTLKSGEIRVYALNLKSKDRVPDDMELEDKDIVFIPEPIG